MVRAKFRLTDITHHAGYPGMKFHFSAVGDDGIPENQRYHRYTPSGDLTITVDNPRVQSQFLLGDEYYLDFTPCVARVPASKSD